MDTHAEVKGPRFEKLKGLECDIRQCVNYAQYRAIWDSVPEKKVCTTHKAKVAGKPWPEVAEMFGHEAK